MDRRDLHTREILSRVEAGQASSQRSLSRELGIALGLTNLLLRQMARKGWVRLRKVKPNRALYFITPAGAAEKARMSRDYFQHAVHFYAEARDRVQERFTEMLAESAGSRCTKIVFLGAGEVAEVGYVCLQRTPLRLVGVVDDMRANTDFFGVPVSTVSALTADHCAGEPFDRLVVMAFTDLDRARASLKRAGVPPERVFWV